MLMDASATSLNELIKKIHFLLDAIAKLVRICFYGKIICNYRELFL